MKTEHRHATGPSYLGPLMPGVQSGDHHMTRLGPPLITTLLCLCILGCQDRDNAAESSSALEEALNQAILRDGLNEDFLADALNEAILIWAGGSGICLFDNEGIRNQTTVSNEWLAVRLKSGHSANISRLVNSVNEKTIGKYKG